MSTVKQLFTEKVQYLFKRLHEQFKVQVEV